MHVCVKRIHIHKHYFNKIMNETFIHPLFLAYTPFVVHHENAHESGNILQNVENVHLN